MLSISIRGAESAPVGDERALRGRELPFYFADGRYDRVGGGAHALAGRNQHAVNRRNRISQNLCFPNRFSPTKGVRNDLDALRTPFFSKNELFFSESETRRQIAGLI